jgi:hypothetical protein
VLTFFGVATIWDIFPQSGPSPTIFTTLTTDQTQRADYIAQADAVCHKWLAETGRINESMPDDLAKMRALRAAGENMLTEWQAVPPPVDDRAEVDAIIGEGHKAYQAMFDAEIAFRRGDREEVVRLIERGSQISEANRQRATSYGFRLCY